MQNQLEIRAKKSPCALPSLHTPLELHILPSSKGTTCPPAPSLP